MFVLCLNRFIRLTLIFLIGGLFRADATPSPTLAPTFAPTLAPTAAPTFLGEPLLFYTFPAGPECQNGRFPERTNKGPDFVMRQGASCVPGGGVKVSSCSSPNEFAAYPLREYEFKQGLSIELWFEASNRLPLSYQVNLLEVSRHVVYTPSATISNQETGVQLSSIFSAVSHAASPMLTGAARFPADGYCERADAIGSGDFLFAQQADSIRGPGVLTKVLFTYDNVSTIRTYISTVDGVVDVASGSTAYRIYSQNIYSISYLRLGCSALRAFGGDLTFHRVAVYNGSVDATQLWAPPSPAPSPVVAWQVLPFDELFWDDPVPDCGSVYRDEKRRRRVLSSYFPEAGIPLYNNAKQLIVGNIPLVAGLSPSANTTYAWTGSGCGDPFTPLFYQNATVIDVSNSSNTKSVVCDDAYWRFCYIEAFPADPFGKGFVADFTGLIPPTPSVPSKWQAILSLVSGPGDAVHRIVQERSRWDGRLAYCTQYVDILGSSTIYNRARQSIGTMTDLLAGASGQIEPTPGKKVWVPSSTACDRWTSTSSLLRANVWDVASLQMTEVGCDESAYHLWFLEIIGTDGYFI